MRARATILLAVMAAMAACGRFDADTSSVAGAADAGSADGARAPGDAAVIEDGPTASDAGTFSCAEGEGRLDKTLDESFTSAGMPDGWIQGDTSNPAYITFPDTPYADGGTGHYLHATVTNSTLQDEPAAIESFGLPVPSRMRLEWNLAVASLEYYGELGCEVFLGGTAANDLVVLYIGAEAVSGQTLIAGWDLNHAGSLTSDEKTALPGWKKNTWQHFAIDLSLAVSTSDETQVTAQASIDGAPPTPLKALPPAPFIIDSVSVHCGVLYLRPTTSPQTMDVAIDDVRVHECVP